MIDEQVKELAISFKHVWRRIFGDDPRVELDFSWPSVGVVDLLLYSLRFKEKLNEAEEVLLKGAAAYLGVMTAHCWQTFSKELQIRLEYRQTPSEEILLRAAGGFFLPEGDYFIVPVLKAVREVVLQPQNPFPAFAQTLLPVHAESGLLSLFSTGLMSGLCPYGRGAWKEKTPRVFQKYLEAATGFLAQSSAYYYQRIHANGEHANEAAFYSNNLIFPPLGYDEPFPATRAVMSVCEYFKQGQVVEDSITATSLELALLPDPLLSETGFAVAAAMADAKPPKELTRLAELRGPIIAALRPAVLVARKILKNEESWVELLKQGKPDQAEASLAVERDLGLLPLLKTPVLGYLGTPVLFDFFAFAATLNAPQTLAALDFLATIETLPPAFALERTHLLLFLNNPEKAGEALSKIVTEPDDKEERFLYFQLKAQLAALAGNSSDEQAALEAAFACGSAFSKEYSEAGKRLCGLYLSQGALERARDVVLRLHEKAPYAANTRLTELALLAGEGSEEYGEKLEQLFDAAPNIPAVFTLWRNYKLSEQDQKN